MYIVRINYLTVVFVTILYYRQVIEGFKPKKAPGSDGITGGVLQLVYKGIPKTMTAIYNECLKTGCFPTDWKTARILPIIKPGREDSIDPTKYRQISLINTVGKVLEKLLIKRIMHIYTKLNSSMTFNTDSPHKRTQ